jgi:hypothetical protein
MVRNLGIIGHVLSALHSLLPADVLHYASHELQARGSSPCRVVVYWCHRT